MTTPPPEPPTRSAPAPTPAPEPGPAPAGGTTTTVPSRWQFWVTVILLGVFVVLALIMLGLADSSDDVWKNRMAVFSAIQAIVFTAVGWLFGREVNRGEAATAKKGAEEAKKDADKARADKENQSADLVTAREAAVAEQQKGRALVAAVESGVAGSGDPAQPPGGQARDVGAAQPHADALRDFARRLYPELYRPS
jgi:hypothetical protein